MQDNYRWQSYDRQHKHSLKAAVRYESGVWKVQLRGGAVLLLGASDSGSGTAATLSASRSFNRDRLTVMASAAYYSTGSYDTRVYLYEGDLPGNFSLQYYYGKGIAARGLVKIKIGRRWSLSLLGVASGCPECRMQADYKF